MCEEEGTYPSPFVKPLEILISLVHCAPISLVLFELDGLIFGQKVQLGRLILLIKPHMAKPKFGQLKSNIKAMIVSS